MSLPPGNNIFHQFPNKVFVETGSYRGDGIQAALDAGFEKIISMDVDKEAIDFCMSRFDIINLNRNDIDLFIEDSGTALLDIIGEIETKITFWLDAHWQFIGPEPRGPHLFPLLRELEQIAKHSIKEHTILIDDWHIFYPDRVGYSKASVKDAIWDINRDYKISFIDNPVKDGILVATIK